jgi:hypothetical protein
MTKSRLVATATVLVMSLAGNAWTVEEPPGPILDPLQSIEWQTYNRFDIETTYPSFGRVFNVWVSPRVNAEWDSTTMATFIQLVLDEDESNDTDILPVMWSYFCYADTGTVYDGIQFDGYDSITLYIYDRLDFTCPPGPSDYCKGYSWYFRWSNKLRLSASDNKSPAEVARDAFTHELQHLCWAANGLLQDYNSANESMSVLAGCMWKAWEVQPPNIYDISYDASVFRCERCDPYSKYLVEQCWMAYLYETFRGSPTDPTDDLIYKWIRQKDEMGYGEVTMRTLARVLGGSEYDWIDGATGAERLATVFQWFLVAKFCDAPDFAPDSRFGYRNFSPVRVEGLFLDLSPPVPPGHTPQLPVDCPGVTGPSACPNRDPPVPPENTGAWNVRILPPSYELDRQSENVMTEVSGIYRDGDDTPADTTDGDKSRDYIDIAIYGTDYIIFKAGSYFQDSDGHEFHFSLEGESPTPPTDNTEVKAWVIGYSSTEDTLQLHPEDIVFIEPMSVHPDSTNGSVVVTDFGRGIKSVVIAITLVEKIPETHFDGPEEDEYFTYKYEYGVYTPIVPAKYELKRGYPNPFNPLTTIDYEVPSPGDLILISIYDVQGQFVESLLSERKNPGYYSVDWDGRNSNGEVVASGVYFVQMRAGAFKETLKIVLLK